MVLVGRTRSNRKQFSSCLLWACLVDVTVQVVLTLLNYGASIDADAGNGVTPVKVAETCNRSGVVQLLRQMSDANSFRSVFDVMDPGSSSSGTQGKMEPDSSVRSTVMLNGDTLSLGEPFASMPGSLGTL